MPLNPSSALAQNVEELVGAACSTGCSPSHRRTRRFLNAIVLLLVLTLIVSLLYCGWSSRI